MTDYIVSNDKKVNELTVSDNSEQLNYVIKLNGEQVPIHFDEILNRVIKASEGLNNKIESALITQKVIIGMKNGMTTTELDYMIAEIAAYMATLSPQYDKLAVNIMVSRDRKLNPRTFMETMTSLYHDKLIDNDYYCNLRLFNDYSPIEDLIDYSRDYDFKYFGYKTLKEGYLLKGKSKPIVQEVPSHLWMRLATFMYIDEFCQCYNPNCDNNNTDENESFLSHLAHEVAHKIKSVYDSLSRHEYTHASPTLFNAGTINSSLLSCFLLSVDDDLESIADLWKKIALISKGAGGIGVSLTPLRAKGSIINSTNRLADGIIPVMKVIEEIAKYVNQGGRRPGAVANYINVFHADIFDFLRSRLPDTDSAYKADLIFTGLMIPDYFMECVDADDDWYLFSPDTAPELVDAVGSSFKRHYLKYRDQQPPIYFEKVKARDICKLILKSLIETGTPYIIFQDAANNKSNQKNLGTIRNSNLCVSGDTLLLTNKGYLPISALEKNTIHPDVAKNLKIYNGTRFISSNVVITNESAKLYRVHFSNGMTLDVTSYHQFLLQDEGYGKIEGGGSSYLGFPSHKGSMIDKPKFLLVVSLNLNYPYYFNVDGNKSWELGFVEKNRYTGNYTLTLINADKILPISSSDSFWVCSHNPDKMKITDISSTNNKDIISSRGYSLIDREGGHKNNNNYNRIKGAKRVITNDLKIGMEMFTDYSLNVIENLENTNHHNINSSEQFFNQITRPFIYGAFAASPSQIFNDGSMHSSILVKGFSQKYLIQVLSTYFNQSVKHIEVPKDDVTHLVLAPQWVNRTGENLIVLGSTDKSKSITLLNGFCWLNSILYTTNVGKFLGLKIFHESASIIHRVWLLLQTVGIKSNLVPYNSHFNCQTNPSLILNHCIEINSEELARLITLNFDVTYLTQEVDFTVSLSNLTDCCYFEEREIRVTRVEELEGAHTTYCFTDVENQAGIFNGILTGQCAEILEFSSNNEIACCNLASICLPSFYDDESGDMDYERLILAAGQLTENLNKIIDLNHYPHDDARTSNMKNRPIAIGVQGFANLLLKQRLSFSSPETRVLNKRLFEAIYLGAMTKSMELAKEQGPYETYDGSPISQGMFQFDLWPNFSRNELFFKDRWERLESDILKHGVRNSLVTAVMPTASTAQIHGFNECIEPIAANIYSRKVKSGEYLISCEELIHDLEKLGKWNKSMQTRIMNNKGSIQNIEGIPDELKEMYKTKFEVRQRDLIELSAERGPFIDQTQSLNLFFNDVGENLSKKLYASLFHGWKLGLKTGIYYCKSDAAISGTSTSKGDKTTYAHSSVKLNDLLLSMDPSSCESCSG